MRASLLVLFGIALGCAASAVGLGPSPSLGQGTQTWAQVSQYCTDTGDFNNTNALNDLVKRAGDAGWELVGVYRPAPLGMTHADYVCFRRPR